MKGTPWDVGEAGYPEDGTLEARLGYLVRYAILAPSGHNTQPWRFCIDDSTVDLWADRERALPVADPNDRELFISLGCALENLCVAAAHYGFSTDVTYFPEPASEDLVARTTISAGASAGPETDTDLFGAITERQTNHGEYDRRTIPGKDLAALEQAARRDDIRLDTTGDPAIKRRVDELMVEADARQFSDPAYRRELGEWIGRGAFGSSWLMARIGQLAVTYLNVGKRQAKTDSEVLMSAPTLAVLSTERDHPLDWLEVGRSFERLFLRATALGVAVHPMSQRTSALPGAPSRRCSAEATFRRLLGRLSALQGERASSCSSGVSSRGRLVYPHRRPKWPLSCGI